MAATHSIDGCNWLQLTLLMAATNSLYADTAANTELKEVKKK